MCQDAEVFNSICLLMKYCPPQTLPDQRMLPVPLPKPLYWLETKRGNFPKREMRSVCDVWGGGEAACLRCVWIAETKACENVFPARAGGDGLLCLGFHCSLLQTNNVQVDSYLQMDLLSCPLQAFMWLFIYLCALYFCALGLWIGIWLSPSPACCDMSYQLLCDHSSSLCTSVLPVFQKSEQLWAEALLL